MGHPRSLFRFIFFFLKQTLQFVQQILQFVQQILVKKFSSSIQRRDSNPQPLEHKTPPTRPGLTPFNLVFNSKILIVKFC